MIMDFFIVQVNEKKDETWIAEINRCVLIDNQGFKAKCNGLRKVFGEERNEKG